MRQTSTYIIAEAGVNHNGSLDRAKQLIDAAAAAGADAVKFQTFKADSLVAKEAPKAEYQKQRTGSQESQYEMLKRLELDREAHCALQKHCDAQGIAFLSTPFDGESLKMLADELKLPVIKIPSGEIANAPFLLTVARTGKPVVLSTGMSTLGEIEMALGVLAFGYLQSQEGPGPTAFERAYANPAGQALLQEKVTLLHCTTEYPAPMNEVNLRAMDTLHAAFGLRVGYSDHTEGIAVAIAAVARGAVLIEKHFTMDRTLPGPDHQASLEPQELLQMVKSIRDVEQAMGNGRKVPSITELANRIVARKSLVAIEEIQEGEKFTPHNLGVKRPGDGLAPAHYWELLGKPAIRGYHKDEKILL